MFRQNSQKGLKKILSSVKKDLKKIAHSPGLLDNIANQLHRDFIESKMGASLDPEIDNKLEPIRRGVMQITKRVGPHEIHEVKELDPSEIEGMQDDLLGQVERLLADMDFDSIAIPGHQDGMMHGGPDEMVGNAIENLDDSVDRLQDVAMDEMSETCPDCGCGQCECEDIEEAPLCGDSEEFAEDVCPDCGAEYCECGDEDAEEGYSIMPSKNILTPTIIKGHDNWHEIRADVNLAYRMSKTSQFTQDHILTLLDPIKYNFANDNIENEFIDTYADILASSDMNSISNRLEKLSYTITQDDSATKDGELTQDERVKLDGPVPYNYQKWFKDVAESHHQAMGRLDEHKNPQNEVMKLRIKDGERSNPIREELASTETRMVKEDINNSSFSVLDNIETMIENLEKKLAGRRPVEEEKSLEALIDSGDGNENVWNQTFEARAESKREKSKEKIDRTVEKRIDEDYKDRKDEYFNNCIDVILDEDRSGEVKTAAKGFGGGIANRSKVSDLGLVPNKSGNSMPVDEAAQKKTEKIDPNENPNNDWSIEKKLGKDNWGKFNQLRKEEEIVANAPPTASMQSREGNDTIVMGPGPGRLAEMATGNAPPNNSMVDEMASANEFKQQQKPKSPYPNKVNEWLRNS